MTLFMSTNINYLVPNFRKSRRFLIMKFIQVDCIIDSGISTKSVNLPPQIFSWMIDHVCTYFMSESISKRALRNFVFVHVNLT